MREVGLLHEALRNFGLVCMLFRLQNSSKVVVILSESAVAFMKFETFGSSSEVNSQAVDQFAHLQRAVVVRSRKRVIVSVIEFS